VSEPQTEGVKGKKWHEGGKGEDDTSTGREEVNCIAVAGKRPRPHPAKKGRLRTIKKKRRRKRNRLRLYQRNTESRNIFVIKKEGNVHEGRIKLSPTKRFCKEYAAEDRKPGGRTSGQGAEAQRDIQNFKRKPGSTSKENRQTK